MNKTFLLVALFLSGCYIVPSDGEPKPPPDTVENVVTVPTVLEELAKRIEYDGKQNSPRALTTKDIGDLFDLSIEYSHLGEGAYTQDDADEIASELKTLEPDGAAVDLDDRTRKKAVDIFNRLAKSLREK